ncbi:hypothetical protein BMB17_005195 [Escherichia coli]|nr:hypothetical protein [Escherichia coli]
MPAMTASVVTASYQPDFERCRLLCETMDRHVTGHSMHYILVEGRDVALFRQLEGPRRVVVDERDLLPGRLVALWDPTSLFRRRVWVGLHTRPLRGWHVQQLRRIGIAAHAGDDNFIYVDSDVAFVRPMDIGLFARGGRTRLFRRDYGLAVGPTPDHALWYNNAGAVLGIAAAQASPHDYITTLIAWRRQTILDMCRHVERLSGRNWAEAIASDRKFSECIIYGRYVDEVRHGADHFHCNVELCRMKWDGQPMTEPEMRDFIAGMDDNQYAIGVQSFTGTDAGAMRRVLAEI